MTKKKHLFFDMDMTVAPSRQPITQKMYNLLNSLDQDIVIVSGQLVDKIEWQSDGLPAIRMGQNGNHAVDLEGNELWNLKRKYTTELVCCKSDCEKKKTEY